MSLLSLFIFNASFVNNRNITDPKLVLSKILTVILFCTAILKLSIFFYYSTECYHGRYLWQHYPRSLNGIVLVLVTIHDRKWFILFCFEQFISMNRLERKFQWFWFLPIIWNIRTHSVYMYCLLWIFNCALLIRVFILISSSVCCSHD